MQAQRCRRDHVDTESYRKHNARMSMREETDEALIATVARGEPFGDAKGALSLLYDRYANKLRCLVAARVKSKNIDDILQNVWQKILAKAKLFKGGSFLAWAIAIAKRSVIDFYRKDRRRKESAYPEHGIDEADDTSAAPEAFLVKEECAILKGCIEMLGERDRAVVTARSHSVAHDQIAAELNITNENARKLWFRAKTRLRDCFESKMDA